MATKHRDRHPIAYRTFYCGNPDCPAKWEDGTSRLLDETHFDERGQCKHRPRCPMSHTPTPWKQGGHAGRIIYDNNGYAVADATVFHGKHEVGQCTANAAHIVRCVNSHDALVAAVKAAKKHLNQREFDAYDRLECIAQLDAALALAEPKETDK